VRLAYAALRWGAFVYVTLRRWVFVCVVMRRWAFACVVLRRWAFSYATLRCFVYATLGRWAFVYVTLRRWAFADVTHHAGVVRKGPRQGRRHNGRRVEAPIFFLVLLFLVFVVLAAAATAIVRSKLRPPWRQGRAAWARCRRRTARRPPRRPRRHGLVRGGCAPPWSTAGPVSSPMAPEGRASWCRRATPTPAPSWKYQAMPRRLTVAIVGRHILSLLTG